MGLLTVEVISEKYGGGPRDRYTSGVLEVSGGLVCLYTPLGTPIYSQKAGTFAATDHAVELYFTDRWYNVWHLDDGKAFDNMWYANVSLPASFDGRTLQWTDLYLDVRCHLDGRLEVLDEDEFETARQHMPADVIANAYAALDEILRLGQSAHFPFDHPTQLNRLP